MVHDIYSQWIILYSLHYTIYNLHYTHYTIASTHPRLIYPDHSAYCARPWPTPARKTRTRTRTRPSKYDTAPSQTELDAEQYRAAASEGTGKAALIYAGWEIRNNAMGTRAGHTYSHAHGAEHSGPGSPGARSPEPLHAGTRRNTAARIQYTAPLCPGTAAQPPGERPGRERPETQGHRDSSGETRHSPGTLPPPPTPSGI